MTQAPPDADAALRSVHTQSFPPLLRQLGASLLVTTYQAGKLVVVRADGDVLNTHFRIFPRPMGLAARSERFAIGTQRAVDEFRNMPAVARKLEPPGKHDAAFLPRRVHVTGDIDMHEMDYAADGQLWLHQHPLLVPVHARRRAQLRAALAPALRQRLFARPIAAT